MTFFANAGIKWPSAESQLQQAGTRALSGGAELWRLFSEIEGWEANRVTTLREEEDIKNRCVKALEEAADTYSKGLDSIGSFVVDHLTAAEIDLVAPPSPSYDRSYYDGRYDPFRRDRFNIRELYEEMIHRIRSLVSQVKTIDLRNDRRDLAFQVFRAMREWELISWNARLIAVLNRRAD